MPDGICGSSRERRNVDTKSSARKQPISRRAFVTATVGTGLTIGTIGTTGRSLSQSDARGDVVLQPDGNGTIHAVEAGTGEQQWRTEEPTGRGLSSPTAADGTAYVGSEAGLYALDTATGDIQWSYTQIAGSSASPTVVDGTVYLTTSGDEGAVHAVDAASGGRKWKTATSQLFSLSSQGEIDLTPSPSVVGNRVYVGTLDDTRRDNPAVLHSIAADTGQSDWTFGGSVPTVRRLQQPSTFSSVSSPTVSSGSAYITYDGVATDADDGGLYAVSTEDGGLNWAATQHNISELSSPTVADGRVFVATDDQAVVAFDATSGQQEWLTRVYEERSPEISPHRVREFDSDPSNEQRQLVSQLAVALKSSPTVADGTVFVGTSNGGVVAVDAASGGTRWSVTGLGSSIDATPTVHDGVVYVPTTDGTLFALDAEGGSIKWRYDDLATSVHDLATSVHGSPTIIDTSQGGDSVGSRIRLGTLGHTDTWASEAAGESNNSGSGSIEFDPTDHGFGFSNWATATETPTFDPPHQHSRVSLEETKTTVNQWGQQIDQFDPSDSVTSALAEELYHSVNRGSASGGHCFGLVLAAQQYHQQPEMLPEGSESASAVSKPTGQYQSVGDTIDRYHNQQKLDFSTWAAFRTLRLPVELSRIDYETQLDRIKTAIDDNRTVALMLGNSFQLSGHAVLAYDYQENGSETVVLAYDPNFEADDYSDGPLGSVTFDRSGDSVTISDGFFVSNELTYQRVLTVPQSREVDNPVTTLVAGLEVGATTLFDALTGPIVSFSVFSPVSLTVECPDGVELSGSVEDDYIAQGATDPEQRVIRYDAPEDDYSIRLKGEEDGQYTVRARSATPDGTMVEEEQTAMINAGATHEFRANLMTTENQTILERVDTKDSDNKTDSTTESDTGGRSLPGPGFVGGLAGLSGGAYWLARRKESDEQDPEE